MRYRIPVPCRVAFSGGRTSAYMLRQMQLAWGGEFPEGMIVTFANTGREVEETLEFVRDCAANWSINIRWVEYCRTDGPTVIEGKRPLIGCHGFREVTFDTASRKGEPFDAVIDVKRDYRAEAKSEPPVLPNPTDRWCSGEMKHRTMDRFMRSLGYEEYEVAVGLRADEPKRVADLLAQSTAKLTYHCPLASAQVRLLTVLRWWRQQSFDLKLPDDPELGTYEGNCDLCFLKNRRKMARLLQERPEAFDWWAEKEDQTGQRFRRDRPGYRQMADQRVALELCEDVDLGTCLCTD